MDLLSRLIAGSGAAARRQGTTTPAERLGSCRRLCNALQSTWRNNTSLSDNDGQANYVTSIIRKLNQILLEESRRVAPHSCLLYTASNQVYIIIAKLAISSTNADLIVAATQFFHFLINGEIDGVLDSRIFARSLVDLVHLCTTPATIVVDEKGEAALIELLFEIATKIRLDPGILAAWFYPERGSNSRAPGNDARRNQFPMFYVLVNYVHRDGPVGDFSRTALLYLTETAAKSRPLEKWMMESDLAPQMASGLSALYSRLSRQVPSFTKKNIPLLVYSDVGESSTTNTISFKDVNKDMRHFLAYLAFWQDTLTHCHSQEVKDTLLDHYQVLFVEQLLYPSLLESSDVQGGSTAAVIFHLCRILDAMDHPQMTQRMLSYLFARRKPSETRAENVQHRMSLSRRTSMENLTALMKLVDNPDPDLFTLHDFITFSLRSPLPSTITSTLKLITILLQRHHAYVRTSLFTLIQCDLSSRQNLNNLNSTMLSMFDLATTISQVGTMDQSYQAALTDAQMMLEQHSCLLEQLSNHGVRPACMAIAPGDKTFEHLCDLLRSWFTNDTLVNLELTGTFAALSACEHIHLASWLSLQTPAENDLNAAHLGVLAIVGNLVAQAKSWREQFVEWDAFYSVQRIDMANDHEIFSMSSDSTILSEKMSLNEQARKSSGASSIPFAGPSRHVSSGQMSSIDGVLASSSPRSQVSATLGVSDTATEPESTRSVSSGELSATLLKTRIPVAVGLGHVHRRQVQDSSEESGATTTTVSSDGLAGVAVKVDSDTDVAVNVDDVTNGTEVEQGQQTASLRHILTQAIILQEFILELAASLQIRATLFDEVDLS